MRLLSREEERPLQGVFEQVQTSDPSSTLYQLHDTASLNLVILDGITDAILKALLTPRRPLIS